MVYCLPSLPKLSQVLSQSDFLPECKALMSQISNHMITPAAVPIGPCDLYSTNQSQRIDNQWKINDGKNYDERRKNYDER